MAAGKPDDIPSEGRWLLFKLAIHTIRRRRNNFMGLMIPSTSEDITDADQSTWIAEVSATGNTPTYI